MGDYTEFQSPNSANPVNWTSRDSMGQPLVGMVNYGDGRMNVRFYARPVLDPQKSAQAGVPQKVTKIFVKIAEPGQRLTEVDREATERDKQQYAREWALYQQNKEQIPNGCPIELLFPADPSIAENLKAYGFYTVEQVANAGQGALLNIMGMQSWSNKAVAYLEQASKGVAFHQYQKDLDERDRQIKVLNQQLEMTRQEIANLRQAFQGVGMAQAQAVMAGQHETRPVFPQPMMPSTQMYPQAPPGTVPTQQQANVIPLPVTPLAPVFDASVAQINAVQAQTRRGGRPLGSKNKPKVAPPVKLEPPSM